MKTEEKISKEMKWWCLMEWLSKEIGVTHRQAEKFANLFMNKVIKALQDE